MVDERSRVGSRIWTGFVAVGLSLGFAAGSARADLYRWVDAKGVVNYSNIPPDGVQAKRIPDSQPTVSVVPPPDNQAELRQALHEAELLRRIEALEAELAAVRQSSVPTAVYAIPAAEPVITYSAPVVFPYPLYGWPVTRPIVGRHPLKPFKPGWGGSAGRPGGRAPIAVPHGRPSGLTVRARF